MSRFRIASLCTASVVLIAMLTSCGDDDAGTNPTTTGTVSGVALDDQNLAPIIGATASLETPPGKAPAGLGPVTTDSFGRFRIGEVPAGTYDLVIDAETVYPEAGNTDIHYIRLRLSDIVVTAGQERVIAQPMYMPRIDDTQSTEVVAGNPAEVTAPSIGGLTMHVGAGAATFPDGTHAGSLSVVDVPVDHPPVQLPARMAPSVLFRVIPEGTTFSPAAAITLPNLDGLPANRDLDILRFGPSDGETALASRGSVSANGLFIDSESGSGAGGITDAAMYGIACDAHTVTGHVQTGTGSAIVGAEVVLLSYTNTLTGNRVPVAGATAITDAQGNYSIANVRLCSVVARATYSGVDGAGVGQTFELTPADDDGTTEMDPIVLPIDPGQVIFDIAGTVRFTNGSPAAGIIVSLYDVESPCPTIAKGPDVAAGLKPHGKALPYGISDAAGSYRIREVIAPPEVRFGLISSTESSETPVFGAAEGTTPALAQSGTTVTVNPTVCTLDEVRATCSTGSWTLAGDQLSLTPSALSMRCSTDFGPGQMQVTIQGLLEGVASIEVEETEDCETSTHTEIFDRVIAGGPTGVSAANLAGLYWRTGQDPPDPGAGAMVVAFLGNGLFALLEQEFADLESGTYTAVGGVLSVHPVYSSHGQQVDQEFEYDVSGNTLTLQQGLDTLEFHRCAGTSGSGLQGAWTGFDESEQTNLKLVIGAEEYAVMFVDERVSVAAAPHSRPAQPALRTWTSLEDRVLLARLGLLGTN